MRGARRRLRRWAASDEGIYRSSLEDRGWDWWPVWQAPWSRWSRPRPSAKALRFVVETFAEHLPAWEAAGHRWHAERPHPTRPIASLYVRTGDLYRCELGLMVEERAEAFWRDWHADDRPDAPLPSVLRAAAPHLVWRALWVWGVWSDDDLADLDTWPAADRRRLTRLGPGVRSTVQPDVQTFRTGVAWVGVRPEAVQAAAARTEAQAAAPSATG